MGILRDVHSNDGHVVTKNEDYTRVTPGAFFLAVEFLEGQVEQSKVQLCVVIGF